MSQNDILMLFSLCVRKCFCAFILLLLDCILRVKCIYIEHGVDCFASFRLLEKLNLKKSGKKSRAFHQNHTDSFEADIEEVGDVEKIRCVQIDL